MKTLTITLEHCYGIKKLEAQFDFKQKQKVYSVYAPNGAMKSSFAKTFKDISEGVLSSDRIFTKRSTIRSITDESGKDLESDSVFVVSPYDEFFGHTEKTSTLLVNEALRKEYEQLHEKVETAEHEFLVAMREEAGMSKRKPLPDVKKEISLAFTSSSESFYRALTRVQPELQDEVKTPWQGVKYDIIFNDKVLKILSKKDIRDILADYVTKYNELIAASTYFKQGVFNYYNASSIAKQLASHGFFKARHTVRLNADEPLEIASMDQLEELIQKEKNQITNDETLKKKFAALEQQLVGNAECREFRDYLDTRQDLVPMLQNIDALREEIWKSYFIHRMDCYERLMGEHKKAQKRRREIEAEAEKQRTQWEEVIEIFNERFFVPFRLVAKNRIQVMLGDDKMLSLGFIFQDGHEHADVERDSLMQVLSTGEKKALYVLNIIFEMEARKKAAKPTLFVFDDIADSFDYKNKYAIIQYLHDISLEAPFCQIILTHNFDFYRTLESRGVVAYPNCLMAVKKEGKISLQRAAGIKNVFVKDWKHAFCSHHLKRIASIPFMRNLIEYVSGEQHPDFSRLTSLLHWKADSQSITQKHLDDVYEALFGQCPSKHDHPDQPVVDAISDAADQCLAAEESINFENKIVLAMATRLSAERFMVEKIADEPFLSSIAANQTQKLLERFKRNFAQEMTTIRTLSQVALMTPENIHLNSFMYEPIIDMSDDHLKRLYQHVCNLPG